MLSLLQTGSRILTSEMEFTMKVYCSFFSIFFFLSIEVKGHLENALDCSLPATLLFDYPTVETLADYLCSEVLDLDSETIVTEASSIDLFVSDDLSDLFGELNNLSDTDLQQRLQSTKQQQGGAA